MDRTIEWIHWLEKQRDLGMDALRIYLGLTLLVKGVLFLTNLPDLVRMMELSDVPLASAELARFVGVLHVGCGVLMALGVTTRLAALVQVPIVVGAVFFVHSTDSLVHQTAGLEFALLTIFLLLLFSLQGAGRFSVDHYVRQIRTPRRGGAYLGSV